LKLKCTKFDFDWDSAPDPVRGAYSVPPGSLAGFRGLVLRKRREGDIVYQSKTEVRRGKGKKGMRRNGQ